MSIHYYANKEGDRKIGRPDQSELYAKINYFPESKTSKPKPEIIEDQNGDGEVSEIESKEAELKAICDEKGIKYDGRNGVESLQKKIDAYEEAQVE